MDGRRAPQGLDAEDRIAFGLTAPRLFYLMVFSMSGWGFLSSRLPALVRTPAGILLLLVGAALAWGRIATRPLDRWAVLYLAYLLRPRRSAPQLENVEPAPAPTRAAAGDEIPDLPLAKVLSFPLPAPRRQHRARRVVFFSLRGGSGRSTLAAELAAGLAANVWGFRGANPGLRVALIDLDFRASTMCITTGLQGPTLGDVAAAPLVDAALIESALLRHPSGARVMLAGRQAGGEFGLTSTVARVLSYLDQQNFDLVVLDLAAGVGDLNSYALQAADEVYYVFDATAPGVYDLYRGVETLRRLGHRDKIRYVANRDDGVDLGEVLGDLRGKLSASVPTSQALAEASGSHRPAVLDGDGTAELLRPLALAVLGETDGGDVVTAAFAGWPQVAVSRR